MAVCCAEEQELLGTFYQSLVAEKLEKNILAFCLVCDAQAFPAAAGRTADCRPFRRDSSHTCTVFSAGRPSLQAHHKPGVTGFPAETQHSLTQIWAMGV